MFRSEIIRFGFVGGFATLTHLGVAAVLVRIYYDINIAILNSMSFLVAFIVSYLGHRHFTFARGGSPLKFFLTSIVGLLINNSIVLSMNAFTGTRFIAILIGTVVAPVAVFMLSKYWAFEVKS